VDLLGKILALACAVVWATAVILFKKAGNSIRPLALNFYKTAVSALVMLPVLIYYGLGPISHHDLMAVLLSGALGIALSDTLFFTALDRLGATLTAIVDCLYAPFVMLASWLMLGQAPHPGQIGGAVLVAAAMVVVTSEKETGNSTPRGRRMVSGLLAGAAAMAVMAVAIALMQPVLKQVPVQMVLVVTELRILAALAVLAPLVLLHRDRRTLLGSLIGRGAWRHALPGALLGNVLSMIFWVAAFKYTAVNSAAILNQTNTILVVVLASLWLKEPFTRKKAAGTVLAFAGAVLVLVG
jgi:drug/metabolite transporter (DMT)-like permease